LKAAKIT